jgi:hypothetical protein
VFLRKYLERFKISLQSDNKEGYFTIRRGTLQEGGVLYNKEGYFTIRRGTLQ